jgi:hypothetical protein
MNVLVKDTPWDSHSIEGLPVKGSKMRPPASIHPGYFQTNTKYLPNLFLRKKCVPDTSLKTILQDTHVKCQGPHQRLQARTIWRI